MGGWHAGQFVLAMQRQFGISPESVHVIGFSYGAHVAANCGKEVLEVLVSSL